MSSCAFGDCGRPDCPVCAPARAAPRVVPEVLLPVETSASLIDAGRADAPALPQADRVRSAWMPKKRHREMTATERMERLGRAGLTVSVCCGPSGADPFRWSVNVMNKGGEEWAVPFAALTFEACVLFAEVESRRLGWFGQRQTPISPDE